jgi:[ribosomal protein S5]-alanine N-acetyltransferase
MFFCGTPVLETGRLVMRRLAPEDAGDMFDYASDPMVTSYVTWECHKTPEDSLNYIRFVLEKYEHDLSGDWGIVLKDNNRLIGTCGFVWVEKNNLCGNMGYVLSRKYWNRGLTTEAVSRVIQFGFTNMGLQRIEAYHMPENLASGRVMIKAGMEYEGTLRKRIMAKGTLRDVRLYSIINS